VLYTLQSASVYTTTSAQHPPPVLQDDKVVTTYTTPVITQARQVDGVEVVQDLKVGPMGNESEPNLFVQAKVITLESQVNRWQSMIKKHDEQLQNIQLHQRGCQVCNNSH
jgi:hypothetical protein